MHERSLPCPKYYLVSLHTETDITGTGSNASARQGSGPTGGWIRRVLGYAASPTIRLPTVHLHVGNITSTKDAGPDYRAVSLIGSEIRSVDARLA